MYPPVWLEVSLLVDGELAEAVSEVLSRYVPGGVVVESTQIIDSPDNEGIPAGLLKVCGYLPVNAQTEGKRQEIENALWYLGRIRPLPSPHFRTIHERDWSQAWKENYHPVPIGESLVIVPAWLEANEPQRIPIRIDPGMAFGTGTHPTTQLCLEHLEHWAKLYRGAGDSWSVFDIGCGSGILSIAAVKLGAVKAVGVDVDADAITAARANVRMNAVAGQIELGVGSVEELRSRKFSSAQASLVLANILAPILIRLLGEGLDELISPNGRLILSGILETQEDGVIAAAKSKGLMVVHRSQTGDWVALSMAR